MPSGLRHDNLRNCAQSYNESSSKNNYKGHIYSKMSIKSKHEKFLLTDIKTLKLNIKTWLLLYGKYHK